jgi:hypothetical protein
LNYDLYVGDNPWRLPHTDPSTTRNTDHRFKKNRPRLLCGAGMGIRNRKPLLGLIFDLTLLEERKYADRQSSLG